MAAKIKMRVPLINVDNWFSTFSKGTFFGTINHMLIMGQPMTKIFRLTNNRGRNMNKHTSFNEAFEKVGPALKSKAEELHLYGYDTVTIQGLWSYLVEKKWSKIEDEIHLHKVVNDIMTIKSGDFMNYTTRTEYKSSGSGLKLNQEELELLLHGQLSDEKTPLEE